MSTAFDKAFDVLMEYEGGLSNNAADRGGLTKYGISEASYPDIDIAALTLEKAKEIYHRNYWRPIRLDEIADDGVAAEVFEQAVNFGTVGAVRNLQRALNYLGATLLVDGRIGPRTLAATNRTPGPLLMKVLNAVQVMRYIEIVEENPTQRAFAKGWLRRVAI